MMHYIRGILIEKTLSNIILEVHHYLGYQIQASVRTLEKLPDIGGDILLYTHLLIKEEKQVLYGFADREERDLFQELLKINNVGPKVALAILSEFNIYELIEVVQNKNISVLQYIPGIGRKTAERLLLEMNNRLEYLMGLRSALLPPSSDTIKSFVAPTLAQQDAVSALVSLGYKQNIAYQLVQNISDKASLSAEELIRLCLQQSGGR